ncbi:MAG: IS110 family transposase [Alkalispirochaeta sp.]
MKMSVGVDLHKSQFTVYWRSNDGLIGKHERYRTNDEGYHEFEKALQAVTATGTPVEVAVESTGNTRYFKHRIERCGIPVRVVNTAKFKVVTESVKKTDRHDAATLAEFLEKDMLPEARLCSPESEELRRIIKTRKTLVGTIVTIKNQLHGLLLGIGIETTRGQLQSKKERRRVQSVLAAHHVTGAAVDPLFETIDRLTEEVKKLEKVITEMTRNDRVVQLIMTIPGAGLITATTIRAFTDDIRRFPTAGKYAAYAGLVPWVQNSNETIHHGRITRRGPVELRTALVQVVMGMVRNRRVTGTYRIMERYDRLKREKGSGKSIIATARQLSEIIYRMLTDDAEFDELKMLDPAMRRKALEMQAAAWDAA